MSQTHSSPHPVVLKFGGTSVRDAAAMRRVVAITERERGCRPVVVTSACAGVTDALLACARAAGDGDRQAALDIVAALRERHLGILADLEAGADALEATEAMLGELAGLAHGVVMLGELSPRTTDAFASLGERLSSVALAEAFRGAGWRAALADSRRCIITDAAFMSARPLMPAIEREAPAELLPLLETHEVVVAQGFIGATTDGRTTTIGRGGSDFTGALLGAALGAREIQIWTDVSGILTADPRIVPAARVVPDVTFTEARELAYFGAKVIHPDTILPAVERSIPVVIKNSMRPSDPGTRILPDGSAVAPGVHSIAVKRGMTFLRLAPRDARQGFAPVERALGAFAEHDAELHCAVLAESRAIAAIPQHALNDILLAALEAECSVEVEQEMALLCMSGSALRSQPAALARAFAALGDVAIAFTSAGTSDHLVLVGLAGVGAEAALTAVHAGLFE